MTSPKRLIDATLARDTATIDLIVHHIDRQPTVDAVEVVRCIDCRHSVTPKCQREYCEEKGILKCDKPSGIAFNRRVHSTDFCPYGEKRGDR